MAMRLTINLIDAKTNRFLKAPSMFLAIIFVLLVNGAGCKKAYDPPAISTPASYLVIEGIINSGGDSTIIKITRTINLNQTATDSVVGALATVEDNQGNSFVLPEQTNGIYVSPGLSVDKTRAYRLRVKTTDNQVYLSAFEPVIITPPIDSVGFKVESSGLQVYVNTHDATSSVKYYRWAYNETWEFHSYFYSTAMIQGHQLVARTQDSDIYFCYANNASSDIPLASTANLSQSAIFQKEVNFIASTSEKLELRYSILVKEYALTADAYNFYSKLESNSSLLGSIFDAQPSAVPGNISCITNPQQPVIGYIGVSNVTSKRVFISNSSLPDSWMATYPSFCLLSPAAPGLISDYLSENPKLFQFIDLAQDHSTTICVDCTIRGDRTSPPFWIY